MIESRFASARKQVSCCEGSRTTARCKPNRRHGRSSERLHKRRPCFIRPLCQRAAQNSPGSQGRFIDFVVCRLKTSSLPGWNAPAPGVTPAILPALCVGRCALNRSALGNVESPCSVRSYVAAGCQAGVKPATDWPIHAVGANSGLNLTIHRKFVVESRCSRCCDHSAISLEWRDCCSSSA